MAKVISGNNIQLDNGQSVTAQNGGWYDGMQFWNGQLGSAGVINNPNQQGYQQPVSADVIAQTNPNNVSYVNAQRAKQNLPAVPQNNNTPSAMATPSGATGGSSADVSSIVGNNTNSTLNLPSMYTDLSTKAGIPDLQQKANAIQDQIDQITKEQGSQVSYNNENPFLSEANRTGREAKINTDAQNQIDALTNEKNTILGQISVATTDINNQIGLATQQYTLNDQAKQEALGQFNTLLSSGLLGNLSTGDIANIAQSTGLPTSVIQKAIEVSNKQGINPQIYTSADGTATAVDPSNGNILWSEKIPGAENSGSSTSTAKAGSSEALSNALAEMQPKIVSKLNSYGNISPADWQTALAAWEAAGFKKKDFIDQFGQYADTHRGDFQSAYGFANPS